MLIIIAQVRNKTNEFLQNNLVNVKTYEIVRS